MKICLVTVAQSVPGFEDFWFSVIQKGFSKILRSDTQVVQKALKVGLADPKDFVNPYFSHLNRTSIVETVIEAEREGYDAAVVGCFADTGVKEARAVVDIPVIGPAESTMLLACMLGRKFAIICANLPGLVPQHEEQVREHGLWDRLIPDGIRPDIHAFEDTWTKSFADPQFAADGVAERAKELVADGADVIVIGCCGIGPFCSAAGLHSIRLDNRNIPILDAQLVAFKAAEMAADLRGSLGLPFTSLPRPTPDDIKRVRARFNLPA
jgi:allantoin racemase